MREIKFRAWDKEQEHWVNGLHFSLHLTGNVTDPCQNNLLMNDRYSVQQFTGLKDKNGKEIYEGDIVRVWALGFKNGNEDGDFGLYQDRETDKVTMDRFPIYWLENEAFGYEGEDLIDPEQCEVIGNIYENPELLKETK